MMAGPPGPRRGVKCVTMRRRVVITGMGLLTAHGVGKGANLAPMMEGRDSIRDITAFDASGYRGKTGGEIPGFAFTHKPLQLRADRIDRSTQFVITAFEEARAQAGLSRMDGDCPVVLGTTLGGMYSGERYHAQGIKKGFKRARLSLVADYVAHSQAMNLKTEYGIGGEALIFSDACASGANAIGHACRMIRDSEADMAVAGGYDTMCEFTFAGFNSLQAVTPSVCRPFDRRRDGLVLGEGAGVMILEELTHALSRGADIIAEVTGYGVSSDAYHITRPDPEARGAIKAMKAAIDEAGVSSTDIDYINAHGTGTPYNDEMEARAISGVFGGRDVPVSSIKAMVGHLLGGTGAAEAVVTVMAIKEGFIPPNINCEEPAFPINVSREPGARGRVRTALSNSFGFGGVNAVLVFRDWEGL